MCRAVKSREGDHFQASIGLRSILEEFTPVIPDWAVDMHTPRGKKMGRGLEHFLSEGCQLKPPASPDRYECEARRMWELKAKAIASGTFPE